VTPRPRILLGATLAVAALLVAAGPAQAGGRAHQLGIYKVDDAIDISGEDGIDTISCRAGDIALDGMWRIDDIDQDNDYVPDPPPGFGTTGNSAWDGLESILPVTAKATAIDTYTFSFMPVAGGDIRVHLFLTCLSQPTTATNGHAHQWSWGGIVADTVPVVAGSNTYSTSPSCPAGFIMIANGFDWNAGAARGNVAKRWPGGTAVRDWDYRFYSDGAGSIDVSWACLRLLTLSAGSPAHSHRMIKQFLSETQVVKKDSVGTYQHACGALYKAGLGAWDFGTNFSHTRLWFLGMDPRPKLRAYKILNADSVNRNVDFGDVCIKERTT
jgi:hypothetical protein